MIPKPPMVSVKVGLAVMVYAVSPPMLNRMLFTCVLAESDTALTKENPNVAESVGLLGGSCGVQFPDVFQSPLPGTESQVAEPAIVWPRPRNSPSAAPKSRTETVRFLSAISSHCRYRRVFPPWGEIRFGHGERNATAKLNRRLAYPGKGDRAEDKPSRLHSPEPPHVPISSGLSQW
jgi:hypothetical protein